MARLKVKQISDFDSKVNSLITAGTTDEAASIDSLESLASSNFLAISTALSAEIIATSTDVKVLSDALSAEISTTNSDVASIDTRITGTDGDVTAVSNAVSAILAGSEADLDQFAEVISYVDSLDTADGGALTSGLASIGVVVSTNSSLDVVLSNALVAEVSTTNSEILSIETVLGTMGTSETITAISDAVVAEISNTNSDVASIDTVIAALGDTYATDVELSGAVSVEKLRAENAEALLAQADEYVHQMGVFRSRSEFAIPGVRFAAKEDLLVFINGHNIHPIIGESGDGWSTIDGVNFTLTNIGYDIDAEDHIYVTGVEL